MHQLIRYKKFKKKLDDLKKKNLTIFLKDIF
jgi:hypothetical protein